jgi:hypothetical protein
VLLIGQAVHSRNNNVQIVVYKEEAVFYTRLTKIIYNLGVTKNIMGGNQRKNVYQ